jgi:hypothetical protein
MEQQSSKKYCRPFDKVVEYAPAMPCVDIGSEPGRRVRATAVVEVLRRLPEEDYKQLNKKFDGNAFQWHIPDSQYRGYVEIFNTSIFDEETRENRFAPRIKVLYLNPALENMNFDIAVAVVAHELAHIHLDHKPGVMTFEAKEAQENAAWSKVIDWGFKEEEEKYRKFRARESEGVDPIIERLLLELPAMSDQRIARIRGCKPEVVTKIRQEMRASGQLPPIDVDVDLVDDS